MYCDNNYVLVNSSVLDYVLKNESNSIAFHHTGEGSARDEWRITYINTNDNIADSETKTLSYGEKRVKFCRMILKNIHGYTKHVVIHVVGGLTKT